MVDSFPDCLLLWVLPFERHPRKKKKSYAPALCLKKKKKSFSQTG